MTKKLILVFVAIIFVASTALLSFGYGVYVGDFHAPPYKQLRELFHLYLTFQNKYIEGEVIGQTSPKKLATPHWSQTNQGGDMTRGLGYVQGVSSEAKVEGVVKYDTNLAWKGLNLYVSGHKPAAYLTDMNGRTLHSWSKDWDEVFPDRKNAKFRWWRRVRVRPNGTLYAMYPRRGFLKLDKDSSLLWKSDIRPHHDIEIGSAERIHVLSSKRESIEGRNALPRYENDYVTIFNDRGKILKEYSILESMRHSSYSGLIGLLDFSREDPLHTNSLRLITKQQARRIEHEAFSVGNYLLSARYPNLIMVLDPTKQEIIWAKVGLTKWQHDPVITEDGQLLVFDNIWQPNRTRILKFDPDRDRITWEYTGEGLDHFFSGCCGTNQELPNGNILIAETGSARALEVTPDKTLAWVFHNPHKLEDSQKYGTLLSIRRFAPDYFNDLFEKD